MDTVYLFADGEFYYEAPSWKSDDYIEVNGKTTLAELVSWVGHKQAVEVFRELVETTNL